MKRFFLTFLAGLLLTGTCFATPESITKRRVLSDLQGIRNIFEVKYAPLEWKRKFTGWDLDLSFSDAKNRIESLRNPSLKECQVVVRDFFNSTQDYHVGVRFYSTESATLPFLLKGTQQRYFVCEVDRLQISTSQFPFEVGDEILTFGGRPIHAVVEELREREFGANTYETNLALATIALTNRSGANGHLIPKGQVTLTGKKRGDTRIISATVEWDYIPEKIRDFSKLGLGACFKATPHEWKVDFDTALKKSQFFDKFMVYHQWDHSYVGSKTHLSSHSIGARSSFIPELGKKVWAADTDWNFDAYIFKTPSGKRVGYIRIPHYNSDCEELEEFGEIMNFFHTRTDALVIDQLNNPGGSVFYLYALLATLTNEPLCTPKHHISMTQEEVHTALFLLPYLEQIRSVATARAVLGDTIGGYPVDLEVVALMKKFCHFLISQWDQAKLYTDPTYLFGVDEINPHPEYRYTKPILLLVNSLNFSGGDFFPAILQDNKRATLLGTRTAGAGGYVLTASFPNHSGIKSFVLTGSHAERVNKEPIENLGVTPDIHYELTPEDLQWDYQGYVNKIVETVEALIQ